MSAMIYHYRVLDSQGEMDAITSEPIAALTCCGCGDDYPGAAFSNIGRFKLCPSCTRIENGLDVAEQYEAECTGCKRALVKDDGRKFWAQCDACAAKAEGKTL